MSRLLIYSLITVLAMSLYACRTKSPALCEECLSFKHDEKNRLYFLYKPANLPANAPLVFFLHGYTDLAERFMNGLDIEDLADQYKMAVCFPQGYPDDKSRPHWNSGLTISEVDDVGFLTELANTLQTEHGFDKDRIFSCGMSNGGFMSYTLACSSPNTFRAIASVTGTMSENTWNNCSPSVDVPFLQISGEEDRVVPIDGSMGNAGGWGGAPPMDSIIRYWVSQYGCTNADTTAFSNTTTKYSYTDGDNGGEVHYYKVKNHGHVWPKSTNTARFNGTEVLFQFFDRFQ